jgi:hypothetical protein
LPNPATPRSRATGSRRENSSTASKLISLANVGDAKTLIHAASTTYFLLSATEQTFRRMKAVQIPHLDPLRLPRLPHLQAGLTYKWCVKSWKL